LEAQASGTLSPEQRAEIRQRGRRRAFMFVYVLTAVVFFIIIFSESGTFSHMLDDMADVAVAALSVVVFGVTWRSTTSQAIARANRIATLVAVLIILATVYAAAVEYGNAMDFGDDLPTMVLGVVALLNGVL
jgi:cation transport ATPase